MLKQSIAERYSGKVSAAKLPPYLLRKAREIESDRARGRRAGGMVPVGGLGGMGGGLGGPSGVSSPQLGGGGGGGGGGSSMGGLPGMPASVPGLIPTTGASLLGGGNQLGARGRLEPTRAAQHRGAMRCGQAPLRA
jgi:hypothetical protein